MRYTIWDNGGRFEYIVYGEGESIIARSGLVYRSRAAAKKAMIADMSETEEGSN